MTRAERCAICERAPAAPLRAALVSAACAIAALPAAAEISFIAQPQLSLPRTTLTLVDIGGEGPFSAAAIHPIASAVTQIGSTPSLTLETASSIFTAGNATAAASGDINNDGVNEVLIAQGPARKVQLLYTANGALTRGSAWNVGGTPTSVASADFDSDGFADFAFARTTHSDARVLFSNGDGILRFGPLSATGPTPNGLAADDMNNDGHQDLVVSRESAHEIGVLLGDGTGRFTGWNNPLQKIGVGLRPRYVAAADIDGDGNIDALTCDTSSRTLSIAWGNGNGGFTHTTQQPTGGLPEQIATGDFDRDGDTDIAVAPNGAYYLIVFEQESTGSATSFTPRYISLPFHPGGVIATEVSSDRLVDLVVAARNDEAAVILHNTSTSPLGRCPGDTNGDRFIDMFDLCTVLNEMGLSAEPGVLAGDVNNDGVVDVADYDLVIAFLGEVCGEN